MNASPLISVCVANYNGMAVVDDCLRSVQAQTGELAVEILVHDDASTDGSADYIRARYPEVRLVPSAGNVGFCVANNRMVDAARGEYLLLLNNDAVLLPDALASLYHGAREIGRPAILSLPQYDFDSGELLDRGCLLDPFLNPIPNVEPRQGDVGMVMGACLWIPRALWEELGGFPEWFGSVGEDLYLCCRARLAGYAVRVPDASGYRHRVGHSFGGGKLAAGGRLSTTFRRRALSERNKSFVMIVCYPLALLALVLPLHAALLLLEGVILALLERQLRPLREIYRPALAACWGERRRLLALRRAVQAQRRAGLGTFLSAFHFVPHKLAMLLRHGLPRIT